MASGAANQLNKHHLHNLVWLFFGSCRSRDRHSSNPNPKLHTPNSRNKFEPQDVRTVNSFYPHIFKHHRGVESLLRQHLQTKLAPKHVIEIESISIRYTYICIHFSHV